MSKQVATQFSSSTSTKIVNTFLVQPPGPTPPIPQPVKTSSDSLSGFPGVLTIMGDNSLLVNMNIVVCDGHPIIKHSPVTPLGAFIPVVSGVPTVGVASGVIMGPNRYLKFSKVWMCNGGYVVRASDMGLQNISNASCECKVKTKGSVYSD